MQAMCNTATGALVGWATGFVSCDGDDTTIEYFNTSGTSQGTNLPATWTVCRPTYSSNVVTSIVQMTQSEYDALGSKDPNTLYVIVG